MSYQCSHLAANPIAIMPGPAPAAPLVRITGWPAFGPDFAGLLWRYAPIRLSEMEGVALQDRTDTKYVMPERQLYVALASLAGQYRVLDIDGVRLNHYRTLYFDTDDFVLFRQHHTGRRERYKVRSRSYVDSHLSFLEVKHKVNRNRTVKSRIATDTLLEELTAPMADSFLLHHLPLSATALEPKLWNDYTRVTLVSIVDRERVTLDLNMSFRAGGRVIALPGVAIAEVKQDGVNRDSAFIRRMRALHLRPAAFSKYCTGVALLHDVRHNNFKPRMRAIRQMVRGENYVQ